MSATFEDLLQTLALRVRLLSLDQVARGWCQGHHANAHRLLEPFIESGWITAVVLSARPVEPPSAPVCLWAPEEPPPALGTVAYVLQRRGQGVPLQPIPAVLATTRTGRLLGVHCRGHLKNPIQAGHDLGLSEVYLWYRQNRMEAIPHWRGEEVIASERRGEKLPDAVLIDEQNRTRRVIEFGGFYDRERLEAFHQDCHARGLPYEIW